MFQMISNNKKKEICCNTFFIVRSIEKRIATNFLHSKIYMGQAEFSHPSSKEFFFIGKNKKIRINKTSFTMQNILDICSVVHR